MDEAMVTLLKQVLSALGVVLVPALTQGMRTYLRRRGYRVGSDPSASLDELNALASKGCPPVEVDESSLLTRQDYNYRRNRILVIAKMAEREPFLTGVNVASSLATPPTADDAMLLRSARRRRVATMVGMATAGLVLAIGMMLYMQKWRIELLLPLMYMYLGFLMMTLSVEVVDLRDRARMIAFLLYTCFLLPMLMRRLPSLASDGWSLDPVFVVLLVALVTVLFVFATCIRSISVDDALRRCGGLAEPMSISQCERAARRAYRNRLALIEGMLVYLLGALMLAVLMVPAGASR